MAFPLFVTMTVYVIALPGVTLAGRDDAGCTMDVVEDEGIVVTEPGDAGAGSLRIWAVIADAGRTAASRAVEAADTAGVL